MADDTGNPKDGLKAAMVQVTPFEQNCTLVWDEKTKHGVVVDPGGDLPRIQQAIGQIGLHKIEPWIFAQQTEPRPLQRRIVVSVETVEPDDIAALGQQPASDVKADKARRPRDQYGLIGHHIPSGARPVRLRQTRPGLFIYLPHRGCRNSGVGQI